MLLEIKDLKITYSKAVALHDISLHVNEGEIISIVGANGAGKTTILRTISGLEKPISGEIIFQNRHIEGKPPHEIVKMGIAHVPAERDIFTLMSVLDNIKLGAYLRKDKSGIKEDIDNIYRHFPILRDKRKQMGGQLSGGQQQMLAVARSLMANPKLLLMDEPSTGLSPLLVKEIGDIIKNINMQGISIILVEQNCRMALKISHRAYVLELGKVAIEGASEILAENEMVKQYYLGR